MLGRENALRFYCTSAVEFLLGRYAITLRIAVKVSHPRRMERRRGFIQMVCVLAIEEEPDLLAFGSHLEPQANLLDPATLARQFDTFQNREQHEVASVTCGVGIGLMILGTLGLVMPWVNRIRFAMTGEVGDIRRERSQRWRFGSP